MYIECDHCRTGYELELPAAALAGGRSVKFRCTACGHSFHVVKDGAAVSHKRAPAPTPEPEPAPEPAVSASMQHVLLRQDGVSYHVPDVATLQRWIVERRVLPTDELDFGGGQWVRAGDRPDLAPFFAIVTEVETVTRRLADSESREPDSAEAELPEEAAETVVDQEPVAASSPPAGVPDRTTPPEDEGGSVPSEWAALPPEDEGGSVPSEWAAPPPEDEGGSVPSEWAAPPPEDEGGSVPSEWAAPPPEDEGGSVPSEWAAPPPEDEGGSVPSEWAAPPPEDEGGSVPSEWAAPPPEDEGGSVPSEWAAPPPEDEGGSVPSEWAAPPPEDEGGSVPSEWAAPPPEDEGDAIPDAWAAPPPDDAGSALPSEWASPPSEPNAEPTDAPAPHPWGSDAWPEADAPSSPLPKPAQLAETIPFPGPAAEEEEDGPADGLSWADELFRDAPLPGAKPAEEDIFDEPSVEGDEPPLDGTDGPVEEAPSGAIPSEHSGWFAEGQGRVVPAERDEKDKEASSGVWLFAAVMVALVLGVVWLAQSGGLGFGKSGSRGGEGGDAAADVGEAEPGGATEPGPAEDPGEKDGKAEADPTEPEPPVEGDDAGSDKDDSTPTEAPPPAEEASAKPPPPEPPQAPKKTTAETVVQRGWRSIDRRRFADAEKHFKDALKLKPTHAVATYGLGYVAHQRGDHGSAIQLYCKARGLAGGNVELRREVDAGLNSLKATCP